MTPREKALTNIPEAKKWVGAAVTALNFVIGFNGKRSEIDNLPHFKALKTHFHVSLGPPPGVVDRLLRLLPFVDGDPTLAILKDIRFNYFSILGALARDSIFIDAPAEGEGAKATAFVPQRRDGTLRITPLYMNVGQLNQTLVLVHESAHFIGDAFQDFAYRDRTGIDPNDPTKEVEPRKYIDLPVQFAIRNADSYAYFAVQMGKGIDRILGQEE
ncbi:hypothetical protein [uncultured Thiodictyon sp.]|jgi:hypothetical protein|uniref:hypothetical protein n=1 Tax=uncultured Thiodictyon sp. TaxID=1846217 RepID=UPI0025E529A9|nr:hypothetical protein [uncultured Thiodictyon sp.]